MNSLNSVLLEGELIADPKTLPSSRCSFYIVAHYENEKGEPEDVDFHVIASGRLGEACLKNLSVGRGVRIVGRLSGAVINLDPFTMIQDTYVFAEHVEFKPLKSSNILEADAS